MIDGLIMEIYIADLSFRASLTLNARCKGASNGYRYLDVLCVPRGIWYATVRYMKLG